MRRRRAITGILALLMLAGPLAAGGEERTLVLVADRDSPLESLTPQQVRLAYLAVPVRVEGAPVSPVLNTADPLLHQVFLQKVIYLSAQHYRRQIVAQVFRSGGVRPVEVKDPPDLVEVLREDPDRISYMWQRDSDEHDGIKTLELLWRGKVQ